MNISAFLKSRWGLIFSVFILVVALGVAAQLSEFQPASVVFNLPAEKNYNDQIIYSNQALLVLQTEDEAIIDQIIYELEARGGKLSHRYPPRIFIGEITSEQQLWLENLNEEARVYRQAVPISEFEYLPTAEKLGIISWNDSFVTEPVDMSLGSELVNDDLEPAPEMLEQASAPQVDYSPGQAKADGAPWGAGFYDSSEFMAGDISVAVILPESTGAIDPKTESWSAAREAKVAAEIQAGLNWWVARESLADISFTYHFYFGRTDSRARTNYEPISRPADPYGNTGTHLWVNQIMSQFGYTETTKWDKVQHFNNDLRSQDGTDWALTFFVADSNNDPNGLFADGYFAYMWVGGPYSVLTYDNDGYGINNMDAVAAHELGHGFYANDQYASACTCNQHRGYLDYYNYNCVNSCPSNVPSIMRGQVSPYATGAVDRYARGQVGIIDANNNGIIDVLEVKPSLELQTSSGNIGTTTPRIEGSARVNKVTNRNPSGPGNDLTISKIERVQYRVDGGGWVAATASDGRFDDFEESFHFTPTLKKGSRKIEVQTKDTAGNWSDIQEIILKIGDGRLVTMAGYTGGPQLRQFNTNGVFSGTSFFAFPDFMRTGARLATGDIDKDGADEIIVGSGLTARPHVVAYEQSGFKRGIDFRPFPMDFTGGVDVAGGDTDGDGKDEVIVSQFTNGNTVKVYRYNDARDIIVEFRPFGNFNGGVTVTAGDVDQDGKDEVICGASVGGGPLVRVFDIKLGQALLKPITFYAFNPASRSGIDVAAGDIDGDGKAEIAVTSLFYEETWVKVYRYNAANTIVGNWRAFPAGVRSGANIEMFDISNDGRDQVIVGPNMGGGPQVLGFEPDGKMILNFFAYAPTFRGGVVPAGAYF